MTITVIDLLTDALRMLNVIDVYESPSAEDGIKALHVLNEMMADAQADGIRMGWHPIADADIAVDAPLRDEDIRAVKQCLCLELCPYFGMEPLEQQKSLAADAYAKLAKRYVEYFESDLTMLPQGDAFGYGIGTQWPT